MGMIDWYLNHPAGDLADWWDKNKKQSEQALYDFVDAHPHYWAIAAAVQTCMDVGAGFVDIVRFGQGMAAYHETPGDWGCSFRIRSEAYRSPPDRRKFWEAVRSQDGSDRLSAGH